MPVVDLMMWTLESTGFQGYPCLIELNWQGHTMRCTGSQKRYGLRTPEPAAI